MTGNQTRRRFRRGPRRNYASKSKSNKFNTISLLSTFPAIANAWSLTEPTNLIRIGADYTQRLGRIVQITRMVLKGTIVGGQSNLGTDDSRNIVRIVVALTGDAFTTSSLSGVTMTTPITNMNVTGLIRVLADKSICLATSARDSTGYIPSQQNVSMVIPVGRTVLYNDSLGGFSPVPRIQVFMLSDSALPPNPGFISGYIQTYFRNLGA